MKNAKKSEITMTLPLMIPGGVRIVFACSHVEPVPRTFAVDPHFKPAENHCKDYIHILNRWRDENLAGIPFFHLTYATSEQYSIER